MATDLERGEGTNEPDAPTRELPAAPTTAAEDRCGNCGAPLAHDQRYCIECGERRGQSGFPTPQPTTEVRTTRRRRSGGPRQAPRMSSGATLIAGVGVLLLAIGLGVLIGRLGHNSTQRVASAPPPVVTVLGGGGTAAGTTTTTTTAAKTPTKGLKGKLKKAATATAAPSAAVQKKANAAAGKVLGNSKTLAPPTVTTGQTCTGAGCQGGKFTGNFFGQ